MRISLDNPTTIEDPDPRPVFVLQAMLGLIYGRFSSHVTVQGCLNGWHILRMNEAFPGLYMGFNLVKLVSEHVRPLPTELHLSGGDVPIPESKLSGLKRELKSSAIPRYLLLCAHTFAAILRRPNKPHRLSGLVVDDLSKGFDPSNLSRSCEDVIVAPEVSLLSLKGRLECRVNNVNLLLGEETLPGVVRRFPREGIDVMNMVGLWRPVQPIGVNLPVKYSQSACLHGEIESGLNHLQTFLKDTSLYDGGRELYPQVSLNQRLVCSSRLFLGEPKEDEDISPGMTVAGTNTVHGSACELLVREQCSELGLRWMGLDGAYSGVVMDFVEKRRERGRLKLRVRGVA